MIETQGVCTYVKETAHLSNVFLQLVRFLVYIQAHLQKRTLHAVGRESSLELSLVVPTWLLETRSCDQGDTFLKFTISFRTW
jgi:hypothetical protein